MPTLLEAVFALLGFIFNFWPILVFAPLQKKRVTFKAIIYGWLFWAAIRLFLMFDPNPIHSIFIPDPLNTILFFATGLTLIALWSLWRFYKSGQMRKKALGMSVEDLLDLPPSEFEEMTAELYRAFGHQAHVTGASGDHGVDVVVKSKKDGKKMIVQCKRWRKPVGESVIRDFYGTMHHEKAAQGTLIATAGFSKPAIEWAKGKPIYLYDGEKFISMWQQTQKKGSTPVTQQ